MLVDREIDTKIRALKTSGTPASQVLPPGLQGLATREREGAQLGVDWSSRSVKVGRLEAMQGSRRSAAPLPSRIGEFVAAVLLP